VVEFLLGTINWNGGNGISTPRWYYQLELCHAGYKCTDY
jgi:hypothetical protein